MENIEDMKPFTQITIAIIYSLMYLGLIGVCIILSPIWAPICYIKGWS